MNQKVFVESEFALLQRVVLSQSEFIFPTKLKDTEFLTEDKVAEFARAGGKDFKEVFPEQYKKWLLERENLKKVLEKHDVEVLRPRLLTDYEKSTCGEDGCSNFFIRDPFFTVGNFVIESSMRFPHRRNEVLPVRPLLEAEMLKNGMRYLSVPKSDTSEGLDSEAGPFLEGGDVLVYGKKVFVGQSGLASNERGHQWLRNLLKPEGYEVITVPLAGDVLHLDCAVSLVREGLMIVCEDALKQGIPEIFADWDKITVPKEQIELLAINGLPVSSDVYILDPLFQDTIGVELVKRGIMTELIDFTVSRSLGGSFRCSTQPLLRREKKGVF